jgi:hypothetical protein
VDAPSIDCRSGDVTSQMSVVDPAGQAFPAAGGGVAKETCSRRRRPLPCLAAPWFGALWCACPEATVGYNRSEVGTSAESARRAAIVRWR